MYNRHILFFLSLVITLGTLAQPLLARPSLGPNRWTRNGPRTNAPPRNRPQRPRDRCPDDPTKRRPGRCGCGVPESQYRTWYLDLDSDGYGTPGIWDTHACQKPDGNIGIGTLVFVDNADDNCPKKYNPEQKDFDGNSFGDACDDHDDDGVMDQRDNCPLLANNSQLDSNDDGFGDACTCSPHQNNLDFEFPIWRIDTMEAFHNTAKCRVLIGLLHIDDVPGLTSLSGLESLEKIDAPGPLRSPKKCLRWEINSDLPRPAYCNPALLSISNNDSLTSLSGLEGLKSIGGKLEIRNNDSLTSLEALNNIQRISGNLEIEDNDALCDTDVANFIDSLSAAQDEKFCEKWSQVNWANLICYNFLRGDDYGWSHDEAHEYCPAPYCISPILQGVPYHTLNTGMCGNL